MKELENKLSSREVAEMMELRHDNLLQKIDRIEIDLTNSKVSSLKYWVEGTYKDIKGEERKEYQITKRGCEFLGHKTTGTKGNLFTDKYMDKFALMESTINNQLQLNADMSKQIAEIVQAQLQDQFNNQIEKVNNTYSQYYRPTALTKRSISDYIKRRLGINIANDEYELVKRRILIVLGAKQWQDVPIEVLQSSLTKIDECIDIVRKDRPYQQTTML